MANTADTSIAGKIVEVTFTGTGADWNHSTDGGFDAMYVKSIIWHPSGADDVLVVNEGGVDGPSIVHWKAYADLVTNGGFASATTGWIPYSASTLSSEAGGQTGNCLKILCNGTNNPGARQDSIAVNEGMKYKLSFYHKDIDSTSDNPKYGVYDESNTSWIRTITAETASATWTQVFYIFTAPTGCAAVRIYLQHTAAAGDADAYYFDTIALDELPINKQISFGDKGVPLKPYIDITDCTFSDITAIKIIFILE